MVVINNMKINLHIRIATNKQIRLHAKLHAYSKGVIPDVSNFIDDAPQDNVVYARLNGQWVPLTNLEDVLKEPYLTDEELNESVLEEGNKYNIIEDIPDLVVCGGTAFSNENEDYSGAINSGNASTEIFDTIYIPMNAKGEFIDGTKISSNQI